MTNKEKSISINGIYYLINQVINVAFPIFTGIYVARVLLPQNIGEITAAQNLAQYFVIFAFLGIPTYGVREIAKLRNNQHGTDILFSELYVINLISTITFFLIYISVVICVDIYREDLTLYLIVGISVLLNAFNISWLYEGLEEFKFISARNTIFKILSFLLLIFFVRGPEDYYIYAIITVFGTAGNYIINMLHVTRFARFTISGLSLRKHLKPIVFLVAVNLAIEIYSMMDITMMNFLCSKEQIAYYKYGRSIESILLQVVNTFTVIIVPRLSTFYKEGKLPDYNRLISKGLRIIFIISCPMIIGILFTADSIITLVYGEAYISSAKVLKIFSVVLLFAPIGYLLGSRVLLVTNQEKNMILPVGIGALINLIGNYCLIPYYGEYGAALASAVSEIIVMIVYIRLGRKFFTLHMVFNSVWKTIVASFSMTIYLFMCDQLVCNGWQILVIQIFGGILIYGIIMIMLKEEIVMEYVCRIYKRLKELYN